MLPCFEERINRFEKALTDAGMSFARTCGYRSPEEQNRLYAQGRTKPGAIVTTLKGGASAHNFGLAMDYIPVINGKRTYDVSSSWWLAFGRLAASSGLIWGGNWRHFVDKPHVEMPSWRKYIKK
ncbi:MAG: M15 family metallopeptidase [Armatimonadota bacterium]